ncbi:MAG: B12-binding domain-containing radical SAM protein [Sulfuricurvum sp.]|jgi:radical SAM superfamily enzyme YgiQ (UPF0313 family)|uniref:B12-binding domain-containing radical SAM protein n=1 Tax=Sulfuricurvum sp. TaxID=2025608 RepID=UPI0025F950E2|nr:radical SAM protein [Sulfuricurvum sp.]MCK9372715.1 B12-binding domain-containing radical SAM protein [Sulfuricurvum sp.]
MTPIILTTLNARYVHTSLGLRCLYANLNELKKDSMILEFTINEQIQSIAERLLEHAPRIIGIGVYIWNASETAQLIEVVKKVSPSTLIVLGGPEAGYLPHRVNFDRADYIISGEGEAVFYQLCRNLLDKNAPEERFIRAPLPDLKQIHLPYSAYSDEDIAHRYIYVEASRGCPFECEFCLSSIDEKVRNFPLEHLLEAFEVLWQRGARSFKFIDRTFNLNMSFANRILDFFLSKEPPYFAHFEVIPDHFPDLLKSKISLFPPGSLQLEIGIQTLDPVIAKGINRPLRLEKIVENLTFLETGTSTHMHLDLIVGLPGESMEGFGRNLDTLCSLTRSEIQIGILKNLSGTTLSRHDEMYGMIYSDIPPYDILQNNDLSFIQIQKMKRFARFWDIYYNSGNFNQSVKMLWEEGKVFEGFYSFSEWIYTQTLSTWKISLDRQIALLYLYLQQRYDPLLIETTLLEDIAQTPGRKLSASLKNLFLENKRTEPGFITPKRQSKRM